MSNQLVRSRACRALAVVVALGASAVASAQAQSEPSDGPGEAQVDLAIRSARAGMFLPLTEPARTDTQTAFATALGGYDSAHGAGRLEGRAEVTVYGPLAVRVGALYTARPDQVRPTVGARVQALSQASGQGVDMSLGLFYKPEGFTEAEGELEAVVALAHEIDRLGMFLNLVYGQDPEGRERDGEVRAAALYNLTGPLQVGLDTRLRFDLGTEADKLADEGGAELDLVAGPLLSYAFDQLALGLQAGLSVVQMPNTRVGGIILSSLSGAL